MLFHFHASEKYLYNPYVYLHKIRYRVKFLFLIGCICLLPFVPNLIVIVCLLIATIFWFFLNQCYSIYTWILSILLLIVITAQNFTSCDTYYTLKVWSNFSIVHLSFTVSLFLSHISHAFRLNLQKNQNLIVLSIPVLYIRSCLIFLTYFILHELLLLTTKFQDIFLYYSISISQLLDSTWKQFITLSLLAFKILNSYMLKVQCLYLGMYLRYPDRFYNSCKDLLSILYYCLYVLQLYIALCSNDLSNYSESVLANIYLLDQTSDILPLSE